MAIWNSSRFHRPKRARKANKARSYKTNSANRKLSIELYLVAPVTKPGPAFSIILRLAVFCLTYVNDYRRCRQTVCVDGLAVDRTLCADGYQSTMGKVGSGFLETSWKNDNLQKDAASCYLLFAAAPRARLNAMLSSADDWPFRDESFENPA